MFEAIGQTSSVQNSGKVNRSAEPLTTPKEKAMEVKKPVDEQKDKSQISQALLDELEKDIEMIHNVGLRFSVHKPTGRTVVKVIDKETQEMVREIPAKEILNLAAKLDEMMGMLFDKTV
jgi:flagellar protein FlaG